MKTNPTKCLSLMQQKIKSLLSHNITQNLVISSSYLECINYSYIYHEVA